MCRWGAASGEMPEPPGNGIEASIGHIGSLKFTGRDLLLVGTMTVLGAAAITVQWMTLTAFQSALARDVTQVFRQADRAEDDRAQILATLRAQKCGEALTVPPRGLERTK